MKTKRFSVDQIVAVLKQAELGMAVADIVRQTGSPSRRSSAGRRSMADCSRTRCVSELLSI